ncbi:hypothetical protein HCP62_003867 [Salmonella enterica subsp. diarizonae]|nr:hypothetical protein [Salmonella enterica subsp. diarizonae]EGV3635702.1 hypothetical protein [Salmonella enterica]HCM1888538.1 hypothetical protein [Salmonella enterica subsp. diarizonae serovar 57:c:z]EEP9808253.1 hypothetical protein [Salmonella enterica subsp. diarizonae]EGV3636088.1 hypothetical protein [Salmonella enterica]
MAKPQCNQTHPKKVVLPKLKALTPEEDRALAPYQQGIYHGMSEMLEMVKTCLMRAGVEYQEADNA